ncbi:coatomer subunit gamma [Toensbergia leucococca]|nr:coatomer subunit gamma [Toensbergia leucococca]
MAIMTLADPNELYIKQAIELTSASLLEDLRLIPGIGKNETAYNILVQAGQVAFAESYKLIHDEEFEAPHTEVHHEQALAEERTKKLTSATPTLKAPSTGPRKAQANGSTDSAATEMAAAQKHAQQLMQIPELKAYRPVLRSSSTVELTESETEYVVSAIKHIYKDHIGHESKRDAYRLPMRFSKLLGLKSALCKLGRASKAETV